MVECREFLRNISNQVKLIMGKDFKVSITNIPKNNGVVYTGLSVGRMNGQVSANIYLEPYYEEYVKGSPLESISGRLADEIKEIPMGQHICPKEMFKYESCQNRIIVQLVSMEKNESFLKDHPFKKINSSLCAVLSVALSISHEGTSTFKVNSRIMDSWGIGIEDVYETAVRNTMRLFPPVVSSLSQLALGLNKFKTMPLKSFDFNSVRKEALKMIMLTNSSGIHGSTAILYPGVLEYISSQMESDLFIIPSSIHEVLILPSIGCGPSIGDLSQMVSEVNMSQLASEEVLAEKAFFYSAELGQILDDDGGNTGGCHA